MVTRYYLICPKPALLEVLQKYDKKYFASMRRAEIWDSKEHPHAIIREEPETTVAKLAFLAQRVEIPRTEEQKASLSEFWTRHGVSLKRQQMQEAQWTQLHHELFGDPPQYTLVKFDRWWWIKQLESGGTVHHVYSHGNIEQFEIMAETVDEEWRSFIEERAAYLRFKKETGYQEPDELF